MSSPVFVLGGAQSDFSKNYSKQGAGLFEMMSEVTVAALADSQLVAKEVQSIHVGNFVGELFSRQGHLGGIAAAIHPDFPGTPSARHEAACASGSIAALAAAAEIEAGRYDVALVLGVEQMRNAPGQTAAEYLGAAAWQGREAQEATYLWPHMFSELIAEYRKRYGLDYQHLMAIAKKNFANAKKNPNAQTRAWTFDDDAFSADDTKNPVIEGNIRRQDCGQITDGAAAVLLCSKDFAARYAARHGKSMTDFAVIKGWGHRTASMLFADKMAAADNAPSGQFLFPHLRQTVVDAQTRAGVQLADIGAVEAHDCFSITEYMLTEHLGLAKPGEAWKAIEEGATQMTGRLPINASGGLIGAGHPVGATGVRMLLDAYKQVSGRAGDYQVGGVKNALTLNIGGSATTSVSFVVGTA